MNADGAPLTPSAVRGVSWLRVEADYRRKRGRRAQVAMVDEPITAPASPREPNFDPDDNPPPEPGPFTPIQRKS